ncbi:hypothetical protein CLV59_103418 [Chitinophaga dinghuensis]|uniref:Uncharacterized protein n=1 Tax=Chitinophaga dinghuensis TaxID=1539050 RepID=A0A327W513_9BACT|nr:hypothetical protein [Chitinophaga dinghuensis]RAJ83450.1 hypothetical protein CLV59_103418 [Chitinophaga dinghuensis]
MQIKIKHFTKNVLLWDKVIENPDKNFTLPERIFYVLLSRLFIDKEITLLTIQPQSYSLGFELLDYKAIKTNGMRYLINHVENCDDNLLTDITSSEEFKRTLLIIVQTDIQIDDLFISELMALVKDAAYQSELLTSATVAYCEDDGNSLYLFNSTLLPNEVDAI